MLSLVTLCITGGWGRGIMALDISIGVAEALKVSEQDIIKDKKKNKLCLAMGWARWMMQCIFCLYMVQSKLNSGCVLNC